MSKEISKRRRVQWSSSLPSRTQQHLKKECDVNSILEKYRKTGHISHIKTSPGQYGDFSQYQDFRSNLNAVKMASEMFDSLPAHVRKRFSNDPSNLVDFISDPKNSEEAIKLGLAVPAVVSQSSKNDDKTTTNEPPTTDNPKP